MKKNILLVYPQIPITFWSMKHAIVRTPYKSLLPPLGILTVAAMIPEDIYNIRLIDMNVESLTSRDISWADVVLVSAMLIQKESMTEVIKLCKQIGRPLAAGGAYPTSSYKEIDGVDYFILGEAESIFASFLEDFAGGRAKKVYMSDNKPPLTISPPPKYSLIDYRDYAFMELQFSRGCPFHCEFCDITEMYGNVTRTKAPEQLIRELDALHATSYRGLLFIVDDNFIGNMIQVKAVLRKIVDWQMQHYYPFQLFTQASLNIASDEELLDLMVRAGFLWVFIGLETTDPNVLKKVNKQQNIGVDIPKSVLIIQQAGIEVMGGFIVGFDDDPAEVFQVQTDFIQNNALPQAMVGILNALPNTKLHRRMIQEGRMLALSTGDNFGFATNFVTKMDPQLLADGYKELCETLYDPACYFKRASDLIKRLPKAHLWANMLKGSWRWRQQVGRFAFIMTNFFTFVTVMSKLMLSPYGSHHARFFFKVLVTKPSSIDIAFQLCLRGHHYLIYFKQMCEFYENQQNTTKKAA